MDSSKQKGSSSSSSSSSIALELFGPKETSSPTSSSSLPSSTSIFSSVFGPTPTERGMNSSYQETGGSWGRQSSGHQGGNAKHGGPSNHDKDKNPYYQQETIQPCHYSSSIYYGGQEVYSTSTINTEPQYKKDRQDDDPGASRGNWWQGGPYY